MMRSSKRSRPATLPPTSIWPSAPPSLGLAAASQFVAPVLLPVAAGLFLYSVIPSFRSARQVLFKEKRLGVDVLDSIVVVACLATTQIFAGTVLAWCLSFGRKLVKKTEDDSKKMLLNVFGKQPRFVWLYKDGQEIETALEKLKLGDIIIVNTGETVPVDGRDRGGHGHDRSARADGGIGAGGKNQGRKGLRRDHAARRENPGRGDERRQRNHLGQAGPDSE